MTSVAFAAARVARPPRALTTVASSPPRDRAGNPPGARRPRRVRTEASASSDATASSCPSASSVSRRAALAAATATVASRAFVPNPDPALALVDDANAQRVFETAARSVVALADYVEGGPNGGGYTPRGTGVVWSEFADGGFVITDFHVVAPYVARSAGASSSKNPKSSGSGRRRPATEGQRPRRANGRRGVVRSPGGWHPARVRHRGSPPDVPRGSRRRRAARMTAMNVGSSDGLLVGQSCYAVGAGDTDDVAMRERRGNERR